MKTKKIKILVEGRISKDEMILLYAGNDIPACSVDKGDITNPCPDYASACPDYVIFCPVDLPACPLHSACWDVGHLSS